MTRPDRQRGGRRWRELVASMMTAGEGALAVFAAMLLVAVPHNTCHLTAHGKSCGASSSAVAALPLLAGLVLLGLALALFFQWPWARPAAVVVDAVIAIAALVGLAVSFASASSADRSTYGLLWATAAFLVLPLLVAVPLLWPPRRTGG